MRILVCFKVVYDLENITPQELLSLQNGSLDLAVFKKIFGTYDEAALETALRLAENLCEQSETVTLHGLTAGKCENRFLENLFPLGFDDLFCIQPEKDFSWQPELTAGCITAFVKDSGGYDIILTGKQAGPGENGLIPRMLAHRLGYAFVPEVFSLEHMRGGIRVISKTDAGRAAMTVKLPAVFPVGEALHSYLRVPTLREKIAAGSREVHYWSTETPPKTGPGSGNFIHYIYTMTQRNCRMIDGNTLSEKLENLWPYVQKTDKP